LPSDLQLSGMCFKLDIREFVQLERTLWISIVQDGKVNVTSGQIMNNLLAAYTYEDDFMAGVAMDKSYKVANVYFEDKMSTGYALTAHVRNSGRIFFS